MTARIPFSHGYSGSTADAPVFIFFREPAINMLFSELIQSRGLATEIVTDPVTLTPGSKVITEPQFYEKLQPETQRGCMVIGNKDALKNIDVVTLSRPLTEEKIELALSQFLRTN